MRHSNVSLVPNFYVLFYVLPDVGRAALLHLDHPETPAVREGVLSDCRERGRERELFDIAVVETALSDALHAARDLHAFEIIAAVERLVLELLQGGGERNALDRTTIKDLPLAFAVRLLLPEHLQPLVQPRALQTLALVERTGTYLPHALWEGDLLEAAALKAVRSDPLESVRELDAAQALAVPERPVPDAQEPLREMDLHEAAAPVERALFDCLQPAPLLELDFFQVPAALERAAPNLRGARRNRNVLSLAVCEPFANVLCSP